MALPWVLGVVVALITWVVVRDEPETKASRRFGGGAIG
jgi:hypothetical protein